LKRRDETRRGGRPKKETDMGNSKRPIPASKTVGTLALVDALVKKNLEVQQPDDCCYFCKVPN
jgi:hypothetical protein